MSEVGNIEHTEAGSQNSVKVTVHNDPGCPFGYSAWPMLRKLAWRYGDQLEWELVLIGLADSTDVYADKGFTTLMMAQGNVTFRDRYGMPFGAAPKPRLWATGLACRAVAAGDFLEPGSGWRILRALQFAHFCTPALLDDVDDLRAALADLEGVDADAVVDHLDAAEVLSRYEADKARTRSAAGTAAEVQGKTAVSDGKVRFTAPSLIFEGGGQRLIAGGFQSIEAYDVLIANLPSPPQPRPAPEEPLPLLEAFPEGLTTQEVAALLVDGNDAPDRTKAELALVELVDGGKARRTPLGSDALWQPV